MATYILAGSINGVNTTLLTSLIRSHEDLAISSFHQSGNMLSFPFTIDEDAWEEQDPVKIVIRACLIETRYTKEQKQALQHFFMTLNILSAYNGERVNVNEVIDCMEEVDDMEYERLTDYMLSTMDTMVVYTD